MTTLVDRAAPPTRSVSLRTLAVVEARRYARHPIFLIGVALMAWTMAVVTKDLVAGSADDPVGLVDGTILPAFFLGLAGVFVGVQLTRSLKRSSEPIDATPTDGVTRTAALCLATVVPGAAALCWLAWIYAVSAAWPGPELSVTPAALAAIRVAGIVFAVGGPLFGVMVGRWTRFPGAGLVAALLLFGWAMLATGGLAMTASRLSNLVLLSAPYVGWTSSNNASGADPWLAGGSPTWYVAYVALLSGLAATAAMLHEARGPRRKRMVRVFAAIAVLAVLSLALAVAGDPTRIPL